eukprot:2623911-Amphidinium_carterae.1
MRAPPQPPSSCAELGSCLRLDGWPRPHACPLSRHATTPARLYEIAFRLGGPVGPELVQGLRLLGPVFGPALCAFRERPHLPVALRESVRGLLAPYALMRLAAPQAQNHRLMRA